jgi:hypothetical protein
MPKTNFKLILQFVLPTIAVPALAICEGNAVSECQNYQQKLAHCLSTSAPSWDCNKDFQIRKARVDAAQAIAQANCQVAYAIPRAISLCVQAGVKFEECLMRGKSASECENDSEVSRPRNNAAGVDAELAIYNAGGSYETRACHSRPSDKGREECIRGVALIRECVAKRASAAECEKTDVSVIYAMQLAESADNLERGRVAREDLRQEQEREAERERKAAAKQRQIAAAQAKKPGARIGMSPEQVTKETSWGKPNHINRTTTAHGVHEQWVYGGGNYLYFENGRLTAIQN